MRATAGTSETADERRGARACVACCQLPVVFRRRSANERMARHAIRSAAAGGAGIVVLPELANSGYVFASVEEARTFAELRTVPR